MRVSNHNAPDPFAMSLQLSKWVDSNQEAVPSNLLQQTLGVFSDEVKKHTSELEKSFALMLTPVKAGWD